MQFYYFMIQRYKKDYQQVKCFLIFILLFLPFLFICPQMREHSQTIFHLLLFTLGWSSWTFIEYIMHRFWMHQKNSDSSMAKTHNHHHTHPTEMVITGWHRCVMLLVVIGLLIAAFRFNNYFTLLTGFVTGIVLFFLMHKVLHLKITAKIFPRLFRYHIYHHCKYPNTCFGITVPWWDDLFKTVPAQPKITERIIEFYLHGHH